MGLAPVLLASIHYARIASASKCDIAREQYHTVIPEIFDGINFRLKNFDTSNFCHFYNR